MNPRETLKFKHKIGSGFIKQPFLTVDAVIQCADDSIVLIRRKNDPFKGSWALPGGFVEYGETVESAVAREVKEETGLDINLKGIVGVYSDPDRDPRGHTVTVCYHAQIIGGKLMADTDALEVTCIKLEGALTYSLAFDHEQILKDAFNLYDIK